MRLIDADALINKINQGNKSYLTEALAMTVCKMIDDIPTITVTQDGDLISRQEALDICNIAIDLWRSQLGEGALIAVRDKIRDLPTIDIDLSKYSDKLYESAYERGKAERKKGEWISCSEYLPMDFEEVLVWYEYFRYGNYNRMYQTYGIGEYDSLHDIWSGDVNGHKARVIAWMPLPEPYSGADMRGEEYERFN